MANPQIPECYTGSTIKIPETYREALKLMASSGGPRAGVFIVLLGLSIRLYLGNWHYWDVIFFVVVVPGWCFIEWGLHNYFLHANPLPFTKIRLKSLLSEIHAGHHRDPWEHKTLFFKWPSILAGWMIQVGVLALLFPIGPAITFATCFIMMIEYYECIHLLVHSKVNISSPHLKKILQTHHNHHYVNSKKWMGVSTYMADRILGTYT